MPTWRLIYKGFDPPAGGLREALCALGNGYFCTRAAAEWASAGGVHYPGTYVAGGYNRLSSQVADRRVENEDLVNLPNWLPLSLWIESDAWFDLRKIELHAYIQELDLKAGVLKRTIRFRDRKGREPDLVSRRFVNMARPHLAAIEWVVTARNWSGRLTVRSALDGTVVNDGVARYRGLANRHLEPLESGRADGDKIFVLVNTSQSRMAVAEAARTRVFRLDEPIKTRRITRTAAGYARQDIQIHMEEGVPVHVEKVVALHTSRDRAISEPLTEALTWAGRVPDFAELLRDHVQAWDQLWRRCDIVLSRNRRDQRILRLHIFHLLQTVSRSSVDLDVGVPARGLHGEAYRGHVFWDELFIFPFLNFRTPEIVHSLIRYRHRRLDEARAFARDAGYRGAMFPWQSGSNGREETQTTHLNPASGRWIPDRSHRQRHVNAAIAYNVWSHYRITGNRGFMSVFGAEILLEIARFWASAAHYNAERGRYEIHGVMGPDEYHDGYPDSQEAGLRNNAYTNVMVAWIMGVTLRAFDELLEYSRQELRESLRLDDTELSLWADMNHKMFVPFHDDGIISQFEGYEDLRELDWRHYRRKYGNVARLDRILEAEGDTTNRYKLAKQADVVMLFYLFATESITNIFQTLGYPLDSEAIRRNVDYYLRRTSHGSTLSSIVHAAVLARYDGEKSWRMFRGALESDVRDVQGGTTAEGIHLGVMAGTVDLVQRGYMGVEIRDEVLYFNPLVPHRLDGLGVAMRYRGAWLDVSVSDGKLSILPRRGGPDMVPVGVRDTIYYLKTGTRREFAL